jgi:hypothetical protein
MLRLAILAAALIGAVTLVVAEFLTLWEVVVITVVKDSATGGEHHLFALALIGVAAAVMAFGAIRGGSRPAGWALLALALAAVFVIGAVDLPDVNEEGFIGVAFEDARARPRAGFYAETIGGALLLLAAVANLVLLRPEASHTAHA